MKKIIFAVLAVLIFSGSVLADAKDIAKEHGNNLTRQQFDWHYKFDAPFRTLYILGFELEYEDIAENFKVIRRLSNKNTQMTEMEREVNRLANLCRNGSSPQCAEVREWLDDYKKNMSKVDSAWNEYKNIGIKKQQEEADRLAKEKQEEEARKQRMAEIEKQHGKGVANLVDLMGGGNENSQIKTRAEIEAEKEKKKEEQKAAREKREATGSGYGSGYGTGYSN